MSDAKTIMLFTEDKGHELFIQALLKRMANDFSIPESTLRIIPYSVRGGHGEVVKELKEFVRDVAGFKQPLPDLIIAATDSNCVGYNKRCKEMSACVDQIKDRMIYAVPEPHVERWMLLDSRAFKEVFGCGCKAPSNKCDKDRYKSLLGDAFSNTEIVPIINGFEFAMEIVAKMDLEKIKDYSLKKLIDEISGFFRHWNEKSP